MIQHITKPFKEFFKLEASSGIVLLIAAILALIISNGSYSEDYFSILKKYITLGTENFGLKLSVLHWINDVLMAVFFFFVSLEIKREFLQGELSNPKQALLPIIGAVGGLATSYLDGKAAVQKANAEIKLKQATGEMDWEQSAIEASNTSVIRPVPASVVGPDPPVVNTEPSEGV